jgi:hypothetical protein
MLISICNFRAVSLQKTPQLDKYDLRIIRAVVEYNLKGDRREPDVFEMVSMKPLAEVGRGCRY